MNEALYYIALTQSVFVALVMLTKKYKQSSDYVLVMWLLTIAFKMIILLVSAEHGDFFDKQFSVALIPLTFGPFLFIYTKNLIYRKKFIRNKDYFHFIPFLILTVCYFAFFKGKLDLDGNNMLRVDGMAYARVLYSLVFAVSVTYYTTYTFYLLRRYKRTLPDNFSYFSEDNELNWLYFLTSLFAITYAVYAVLGFYNLYSGIRVFEIDYYSDIGLTLLTFGVSYFGIKQPYLFKEIPEDKDDKQSSALGQENKEKYKQSNLTEEVKTAFIAKLQEYMVNERPYMNPELTVQDLSKQVNIARHHLTEILNSDIGKNFFTFINEYRINAVKRRLMDEKFDHLTIIAIAYDCGFNSKSTFNSIFKQHTNMTPSKWKAEEKKKEA